MRQKITIQELQAYRQKIENAESPKAQLQAVIAMYHDMQSKGYTYAGWAKGVAAEDNITGKSAVQFMKSTAAAYQKKDVNSWRFDELVAIKRDMAFGYLDTLIKNAKEKGYVTQDPSFKEIREFHNQAFVKNGLSLRNWTLEAPMQIIKKCYGGTAAQEAIWEKTLSPTEGDGADAVAASTALATIMVATAANPSNILQPSLPEATQHLLEKAGIRSNYRYPDFQDRVIAAEWLRHMPIKPALEGVWEQGKQLITPPAKPSNPYEPTPTEWRNLYNNLYNMQRLGAMMDGSSPADAAPNGLAANKALFENGKIPTFEDTVKLFVAAVGTDTLKAAIQNEAAKTIPAAEMAADHTQNDFGMA